MSTPNATPTPSERVVASTNGWPAPGNKIVTLDGVAIALLPEALARDVAELLVSGLTKQPIAYAEIDREILTLRGDNRRLQADKERLLHDRALTIAVLTKERGAHMEELVRLQKERDDAKEELRRQPAYRTEREETEVRERVITSLRDNEGTFRTKYDAMLRDRDVVIHQRDAAEKERDEAKDELRRQPAYRTERDEALKAQDNLKSVINGHLNTIYELHKRCEKHEDIQRRLLNERNETQRRLVVALDSADRLERERDAARNEFALVENRNATIRTLHAKYQDAADQVFQDQQDRPAILPDFLKLSDDKAEGIIKLANSFKAVTGELALAKSTVGAHYSSQVLDHQADRIKSLEAQNQHLSTIEGECAYLKKLAQDRLSKIDMCRLEKEHVIAGLRGERDQLQRQKDQQAIYIQQYQAQQYQSMTARNRAESATLKPASSGTIRELLGCIQENIRTCIMTVENTAADAAAKKDS